MIQYTNKAGIGVLQVHDDGNVTVNGTAMPDAVVTHGTGGAMKVSVNGQEILLGWDDETEPLPTQDEALDAQLSVVEQAFVRALGPDFRAKLARQLAPAPWDKTTRYAPGDLVLFGGEQWRSTSENTNNMPDDIPGDWERVQ